MPDFTAHFLFGNSFVKELSNPVAAAIEKNRNAFHWGLQGPDLLLFRKAVTGGSLLPKYSGAMHSEKSRESLLFMADYIAAVKDERTARMLSAYFYGFLCHYCLDRTAHPFVFYKEKKLCESGGKFGPSAIHCLIEAQIDSKIYKKMKGEPITHFHAGKEYLLDPALIKEASKMLAALLRQVYGFRVEEAEIEKSFSDAVRFTKLFYDPTGILRIVASALESLSGKPGALSSHFKKRNIPSDILNEKHKPWCNLWQPEKTMKESFYDLFDSAGRDAVALIEAFAKKLGGSEVVLPGDLDIPFANGDCEVVK